MDVQQANRISERFPLAGKWYRRWMIAFLFYLAAWTSLSGSWFFLLPTVLGAAWLFTELYGVARGRSDYVELLANGVLLVGGTSLCNARIAYERIASADLRDRWLDRVARSVLRIIGKPRPPSLELRFRGRVRVGWWPWGLKRMYARPLNPQAVVAALSPLLGAT
jgi:hypothetical protein